MAEAYAHMPMPRRGIYFAKCRIGELDREIDKLTQERILWNALLDLLKPCGNCDGQGELRHFIAQDEVNFEKCPKCNGVGAFNTSTEK